MHQIAKPLNRLQLLFAVFLIVLLMVSGYSMFRLQQLEKDHQRISYQAEAMYQRSFGELADSVQTMNEQLAKLLVTSSREQLLYGLSGLWREVYSAISSLGALPVAMHQLEQTDLLLHDVAEYSYYLMRKNVLNQQPLSSQDWQQLEDFYRRSGIVQQELERLETSLLTEDFRLAALSVNDEENLVAAAFRSIESQVTALPEIQFEEGVRKIEPEPQPIQGSVISESEAIDKANAFLSILENTQNTNTSQETIQQGSLAFIADHAKLPVYGIAYPDNRYVEVSCTRGLILQYYHTRELQNARLSASQAEIQAQNILHKLQLYNMVCVESSMDGTTASFSFVPQQEQVYLYPDMINLQLALDDGTLLSFDQTSYQTRHHHREIASPRIEPDAILQNRNPNFTVDTLRLALIMDEYSTRELLVYELRGRIIGENFSIFIDANTGQELRIVRL